jgi:hypothetical protein
MEIKKRSLLSGTSLKRYEVSSSKDNSHAPRLRGVQYKAAEDPGVQYKAAEDETISHPTPKATWLNRVEDKWDKLFYQTAFDWELTEVPAEAKSQLDI